MKFMSQTDESGDQDYGIAADNYLVIGRALKSAAFLSSNRYLVLSPSISSLRRLNPVRPRWTLRARAGFSMLELLVVLAMGAIMAKVSVGRIHDLMSQQRVAHAATAVQNDLEAAFQIAGRNRQPVLITWDGSIQQFSITNPDATTTFRKINLGRQAYGFASNAVSVSSTSVKVYPNGLAGSTLLITISSNGFTKRLRMSRAGLVQIQ